MPTDLPNAAVRPGPALAPADFTALCEFIHREAGIALTANKEALVASRLARRLRELHLRSYGEYLELVRSGRVPDELQHLLNAITTNKTDFFREPHHFDFLRHVVVPAAEERGRRTGHNRLRIWSAGCSSGEEPYTIAMTLLDAVKAPANWDIRILASDIDTNVLQTARAGIYDAERVDPVPPELRRRFLLRSRRAQRYKVKPEVERLVTFRRLNFSDANWGIRTTFDVIFCRNVIIYFDRGTQDRLLKRFADLIEPGGHLILGHSENIAWLSDLFAPCKQTVYRLQAPDAVAAVPDEPGRPDAPPQVPVTLPVTALTTAGHTPEPATRAPAIVTPVSNPTRITGARRRSGPDPGALADVRTEIRIGIGELHASSEPACVKTVLGSCIATCLFDPVAHVGGMNHFLLPSSTSDPLQPTRYGVHAMEVLINDLMKHGGDRRRFQAKVFGAGHVLGRHMSPDVPRKNAQFIEQFLETEGIPVLSRRLGGDRGLEVRFYTYTGRAFVRPLCHQQPAVDLAEQEERFELQIEKQVNAPPSTDDVTLF